MCIRDRSTTHPRTSLDIGRALRPYRRRTAIRHARCIRVPWDAGPGRLPVERAAVADADVAHNRLAPACRRGSDTDQHRQVEFFRESPYGIYFRVARPQPIVLPHQFAEDPDAASRQRSTLANSSLVTARTTLWRTRTLRLFSPPPLWWQVKDGPGPFSGGPNRGTDEFGLPILHATDGHSQHGAGR